MEQQISVFLREAADQPSRKKRREIMQQVLAIEDQIMQITTRLERAKSGPVKVPTLSSTDDVVYRPTDFVGTTECVVVRDSNGSIPADSVIFLEHTTKPEAYLINRSGRLHLTKELAADSDVVGAASYVLLPAQVYADTDKNK